MRNTRSRGDRKLVGILVVVMVAIVLTANYLKHADNTQQQAAAPPDAVFVPGPVTLAPGLHLLGALAPSVAYVIETSDGLILVDTGLADAHDLLLNQLEVLGLNIQDLRLILLTHGHGDHYLGAMDLRRLTGAKVHVGKGDSQVLQEAGPREAVFSTFPMKHVPIHPTTVDVELFGGETIRLGDVSIQVIATPGHTPGSMCYLLKQDGKTALFSGDTIMTITGDLGTYATYLPPRYRGNAADYLSTLRQLRKMPAPEFLLPGHPRTIDRNISARISPQQWSALLDDGIRNMQQLTERYRADGADFLDGHARELLPGLYYLGDYSGLAAYCFTNGESAVLFDAPGNAGLSDFLKQQLGDVGLSMAMVQAVVITGTESASIAGLDALVEATGCRVVAAESHHDDIHRLCPEAVVVLPEASVAADGWLPLQPISVTGFGPERMAWQIAWADKTVAVTGKIPLKLTEDNAAELRKQTFDPKAWSLSLDCLRQIRPALWLPAVPVHGQSANLYGDDWKQVIRENELSLGMGIR